MNGQAILALLFSVLIPGIPLTAAEASLHQEIDRHIAQSFQNWKLNPNSDVAETCSDSEFVRRLYLDLTGKIPTSREASHFQIDNDPEKRRKLIDQLLTDEAWARHMAVVFDVMLMERRPDKYVTTPEWREWLADSFANDKPLDEMAREILVGGGVEDDTRPAGKFYLDRAVNKDTLVRDTGRLFLGMDLQCAQCHDHPTIDDWKHQHYFGLSVFFAGSKTYKRSDGKFVLQESFIPSD